MPKKLNIVKYGDYSKSGCILWWGRNRYDQNPNTSKIDQEGHTWYLLYIERCKNTHSRLKIGSRIESVIKQAGYIYNIGELNYEIVYDQDEITQEYNLVKTLKPLFQSVDI